MPTPAQYAAWRQQLDIGETQNVLKDMKSVLEQSPKLTEVLKQSARFNSLLDNIIMGQASFGEQEVVEHGIRSDLFELITDLENQQNGNDEIARELAKVKITGNVTNAVFSSHIQAGGDVHIGDQYITRVSSEPLGKYLSAPPFKPEMVLGRSEDITVLHQHLITEGESHIVQLRGEGGIGKSTLAAAYFNQFANEYDHLGWAFSAEGITSALLRLAPGLQIDFSPQETEPERLERILRALANLKGNCLLVLDNVDNQEDLEESYHLLAKITNVRVLLTSRLAPFPGTISVDVNSLGTTAAQELFIRHYRMLTPEETATFDSIYQAVGGNTLVLELLAKNLKRVNALKKDKYDLEALLSDLQRKGVLQLSQQKTVTTSYGGELQKAEAPAIISAMYDLGGLDETQSHLLLVFAVLRAYRVDFLHLETLLTDLGDLEDPLLDLSAAGWLEFNEEQASFRCSPVVQEVVRASQPDWPATLAYLPGKLNDQLLFDAGGHLINANLKDAWPYVAYAERLTAYWEEPTETIVELWQRMGSYFAAFGEPRKALGRYYGMFLRAKTLQEKNPTDTHLMQAMGIAHFCMARMTKLLGEPQKALAQYKESLRWQRMAYEKGANAPEHINQIATTLRQSGSLLLESGRSSETGNLPEAENNLSTARRLFEQITQSEKSTYNDWNGLALTYASLAEVHRRQEDTETAEKLLEAAINIHSKLKEFYPDQPLSGQHLSAARQQLADLYQQLGRYHEAAKLHQQNVEELGLLADKLPNNVTLRRNHAVAYGRIGEMHLLAKQAEDSIKYYGHAVHLILQMVEVRPGNHDLTYQLALAWRDLGRGYQSIPEHDKAIYAYSQCLAFLEELMAAVPENLLYKEVMAGLFYHLSLMAKTPEQAHNLINEGLLLYRELEEARPQVQGYVKGRSWGEEKLENPV